jgi:hypothetical protein
MNTGNIMKKWQELVKHIYESGIFNICRPSFCIEKNSNIFTIGSCFARNIEEKLENYNLFFPITKYKYEVGEYQGERPRGILNKFTPCCILKELQWVYDIHVNNVNFEKATFERYFFDLGGGRCVDLGLQQYKEIEESRFWSRREHIFSIYKNIVKCDVIIITLGLIEQWFYEDLIIEHAPNSKSVLNHKNSFYCKLLTVDTIKNVLQEIIRVCRVLNPYINIIISVSPVPMKMTFTKKNILSANLYSKSKLILAAQEVAESYDVDYFPSYEMVNFIGSSAFKNDLRHVKDNVVANICSEFYSSYVNDSDKFESIYEK